MGVDLTLQMVTSWVHMGISEPGWGPGQRAFLLNNSPLRERENLDAAFGHLLRCEQFSVILRHEKCSNALIL